MADRKLIATGNTNNPAIYDGGTLPNPGDNVHANGFTGTINASSNFHMLTTANVGIGAAAGGGFACSSAVTITGNITSGTTVGLTLSGANLITVIGSGTGGSSNFANAIANNCTAQCTFVGNYTGGAGIGAVGIQPGATSVSVITGNVTCGIGTNAYGFFGSATCTATINGNSIGGVGGNGVFVSSAGAIVTVNGYSICSSTGVAGVQGTSITARPIILAAEYSSTGASPTVGWVLFKNTNSTIKIFKQNSTTTILSDPAEVAGLLPAAFDLRYGVSCNNGQITGTLRVPQKGAVLLGVLTDDGLGEASLDGETLALAILNAINVSTNPIAERLRNVSTVQTDGSQLAAALS